MILVFGTAGSEVNSQLDHSSLHFHSTFSPHVSCFVYLLPTWRISGNAWYFVIGTYDFYSSCGLSFENPKFILLDILTYLHSSTKV